MNDGSTLYYGTANTALIESLVANFEEYLAKFVHTSISNVSKEFAEIDENLCIGAGRSDDQLVDEPIIEERRSVHAVRNRLHAVVDIAMRTH